MRSWRGVGIGGVGSCRLFSGACGCGEVMGSALCIPVLLMLWAREFFSISNL